MKRNIAIHHITGTPTRATAIIDKNGMRFVDKSEYCTDSSLCKGFLTYLIDMDQWNHSWHIDVSKAQFKSSDERKRVREIIKEKIEQREEEIRMLKDGLQILGRWNVNTN